MPITHQDESDVEQTLLDEGANKSFQRGKSSYHVQVYNAGIPQGFELSVDRCTDCLRLPAAHAYRISSKLPSTTVINMIIL